MKGFAATLDSVVAISFLFFALALIATQTYEPRAPGGVYLKQLTLDTLTVLEKTGRLGSAIDGNESAIPEVLEATPHLSCVSISIINSTGDEFIYAEKSGCTDSEELDLQVATLPLVHRGEYYIVKSESWFRKEGD